MIDEKKLIEELEERRSHMIPDSDSRHSVSIEKVIDYISKFPPADQWIPCSRELPKKSSAYVVTEKLDDGRSILTTTVFEGGEWLIERLHEDTKVVAWLNAEPYKGVE
jgi:hypothetical protein